MIVSTINIIAFTIVKIVWVLLLSFSLSSFSSLSWRLLIMIIVVVVVVVVVVIIIIIITIIIIIWKGHSSPPSPPKKRKQRKTQLSTKVQGAQRAPKALPDRNEWLEQMKWRKKKARWLLFYQVNGCFWVPLIGGIGEYIITQLAGKMPLIWPLLYCQLDVDFRVFGSNFRVFGQDVYIYHYVCLPQSLPKPPWLYMLPTSHLFFREPGFTPLTTGVDVCFFNQASWDSLSVDATHHQQMKKILTNSMEILVVYLDVAGS